MLKDNTSQESVEKFESVEIFKNKVSELEKVNASANGKIADLERANASANGKISDLERANADLEAEIKYANVNKLISNLLTKKVNLRECNVINLKEKPFFKDFDFDQLIDFKLTPPYIPLTSDMTQYLSEENPYEAIVSHDNYIGGKKDKEDYFPPGYDRHWADEF